MGPLDAARVLHAAGEALFNQAQLHGQLASVEWEEEKNRLLKMLAITLVGFGCLVCALLFAGGLALAVTWETPYRLHTFAALVVLFGIGTAVAWHRFWTWAALGASSFAATREELAADTAVLKAST